jgi:hypothetical protein
MGSVWGDIQELSELSLEDTVGDEFSLLGDLGRSGHFVLMDEGGG